MTQLYIIRHGQAYSQLGRQGVGPDGRPVVIGGVRGDAGLTPLGIRQAEALRDRLRGTGEIQADVVLASSLPRARQTAEIVAPALGVPVTVDDELHELRPGEADGMTFAEFEAQYGFPDLRIDAYRPFAPSGESWADFTVRVGRTLHRITREHSDQTVVIFAHGGVIDVSFLVFFQLPILRPGVSFRTRNTSITHWSRHIDKRDGTPSWRLMRYNDDLHVRSLGEHETRTVDWSALRIPPGVMGTEAPSEPLPTESTDDHGDE